MPLEILAIPAVIFGILGFIRGLGAYKRANDHNS